MRSSIARLGTRFTTNRMLVEYVESLYLPAHRDLLGRAPDRVGSGGAVRAGTARAPDRRGVGRDARERRDPRDRGGRRPGLRPGRLLARARLGRLPDVDSSHGRLRRRRRARVGARAAAPERARRDRTRSRRGRAARARALPRGAVRPRRRGAALARSVVALQRRVRARARRVAPRTDGRARERAPRARPAEHRQRGERAHVGRARDAPRRPGAARANARRALARGGRGKRAGAARRARRRRPVDAEAVRPLGPHPRADPRLRRQRRRARRHERSGRRPRPHGDRRGRPRELAAVARLGGRAAPAVVPRRTGNHHDRERATSTRSCCSPARS